MAKHSIKEIVKNLILSFFSYALPTVVLQFVVQPIIAARLGAELNGQYLTLMSLNFFIISITASVLNTVRMLQDAEYKKRNVSGDFNVFFLLYAIFIVVALPIGYMLYTKSFNVTEIILYAIVGILYLYHDYIFADYRLRLKYNKILINNVILVAGYAIGTIIFYFWLDYWQIVFIVPYALGGIYDLFNTTFIREPLKTTPLFATTGKKVALLMGANVLGSAMTYCDKLLLYPLLGGFYVSIYNTAALVGKVLIMVSAPLQSVLLSYLVKTNDLKVKFNKKFVLYGLGLLVVGYASCVAVGYPLIHLLYPSWADVSFQFVPITVASSVLALANSLLNTLVVRFHKTSFQMVVQAIDLAVYLVASLILLHFFGLWGFCIGILLASLVKMAVLLVVIFFVKPTNVDSKEPLKEQEE